MRFVACAALSLYALAGCAASPYAKLDDPRPEGRLSLRERAQCEVPDQPQSHWCDFPHEVRAFISRRENCDHFRGEPIPEPQDDPRGERRRQIEAALTQACMGTDAELARLRAKYGNDADIAQALAGLETTVEP